MAGAAGRRLACAGCEMGRARGHLERAVAELEEARLAWGVWADGIRKVAERRLGVSCAGGLAVLDHPGYARALRLGAWFDEAAGAAEVALEAAGGAGTGGLADCPCMAVKEQ